jgi:hypothetical protein
VHEAVGALTFCLSPKPHSFVLDLSLSSNGVGRKSEANPRSKRTTEKAREVQNRKMENENDSELGKLLLEGERGGVFYLQICMSFLVGSMLICAVIVNIYLMFSSKILPSNIIFNVIFCFICLLFAPDAFLIGFLSTKIKIQVFENGFQYCDEKIFFRDVKKFRYSQIVPSKKAFSFDFTMNNQQEKSFSTVGWSNESILADLLKKKVIGQL